MRLHKKQFETGPTGWEYVRNTLTERVFSKTHPTVNSIDIRKQATRRRAEGAAFVATAEYKKKKMHVDAQERSRNTVNVTGQTQRPPEDEKFTDLRWESKEMVLIA
jgi:hypothetical protein